MPYQHHYNTRSSTARGQPSKHHLDNHQQQHLDNHQQQRLDSHQQQHLDNHQQQHLDTHQHDPGFDYSKSSRSPETRAISSYYDSGQDILHSYEYEHDRRNNHHEYYSHDTPRNRDRNQSLLPDANAPFGYQLDVTGRKYPAPDPNQLWRVKELNGAHTERTTREIENLSGYWSIDPNGTQYFHRTVPIEVCRAIRQVFVLANSH